MFWSCSSFFPSFSRIRSRSLSKIRFITLDCCFTFSNPLIRLGSLLIRPNTSSPFPQLSSPCPFPSRWLGPCSPLPSPITTVVQAIRFLSDGLLKVLKHRRPSFRMSHPRFREVPMSPMSRLYALLLIPNHNPFSTCFSVSNSLVLVRGACASCVSSLLTL